MILIQAIRNAMVNDLVVRNVADLWQETRSPISLYGGLVSRSVVVRR